MIDPDNIKRIAREQGLPAGIIEKDYAITILLVILCELPFINRMAFKGGTAIKKIYFPEARFSEDLDFTCYEDISKTLIEHLERAIKGRNWLGVRFTEVGLEETSPNSARVVVQYLDFNDHPNRINLDLSMRERPVLKTSLKRMPNDYNIGKEVTCSYLHFYSFDDLSKVKQCRCELRGGPTFASKLGCFTCEDFTYDPAIEPNDILKAVYVRTMELNEILAEKVRALLRIERPRHLYDIWFLLNKGAKINLRLVNEKLKLYNEKFQIENMKKAISELKDAWERDLKPLIAKAEVPSISSIEKQVTEAFQAIK